MKKVLIILGIALFQLLAGWPVRAQVPVPEPARNMARLVLEDSTYVHVLMGVHGENGDFEEKDIFMPESMLRGTMDAYSRQTLDKVHLFGHFGYSYELGKRSTWRGWIDPYETPFMLADSIPGDISIERYAMQAGMAMPLGNGWSAGLDLSYNVALLAKHKDLRNKNTGTWAPVLISVMNAGPKRWSIPRSHPVWNMSSSRSMAVGWARVLDSAARRQSVSKRMTVCSAISRRILNGALWPCTTISG